MERKKLISLAKELNKVLDLEPVIPTQPNVKEATLVEKITTAAGLIDLENDTFSEEAIEIMQELDVWPGDEAGEAAEGGETTETEPEPEPEPVKEKAKDKGKEKPAAETAKEKPVKPAKEKVKKLEGKSEFGHRLSSQAGQIDTLLLTTKKNPLLIEEMCAKLDLPANRVKSHIQYLNKKELAVITLTKESKYKLQ